MPADLRDWLDKVEAMGQLRRVDGANWELEMGAVAEVVFQENPKRPAVLFDNIKDYPQGRRVLINLLGSLQRLGLTLGLPNVSGDLEFVQLWRERIRHLKPIPPKYVDSGPVTENIRTGESVNILEFPAPKWHALDGGRFIGTGSVTITKDPEEGWVNLGTYRVMVHDKNTVSFYMDPNRHGNIQRQKYFAKGQPCPVAISVGQDPLLFAVASTMVPYGLSEYDYAGAIRGEPIEVIRSDVTGLPIPAASEIVIEGECFPGDKRMEGPFGEFHGYYASGAREEPFIRVHRVLFRNDPIICGVPPLKPPSDNTFVTSYLRPALLMNELQKAGVPDVKAVWGHGGLSVFFLAISIKQRYPGHAKQVGTLAAHCMAGNYMTRFVVVVDDDIDVSKQDEVIWAMCTRSDPQRSLNIIRRCTSGPLDPAYPPGKKGLTSRAVIDACRPFEWMADFPRVVEADPALLAQMREQYLAILSGRGD